MPPTGPHYQTNCSLTAASRGTRWHATDGSGTVFINDVDNGVGQWPSPDLRGVVITADGTRIRFGEDGGMTDRNGNQIAGTDQLGRTITTAFDVPDPENPSVTLAVLVTVPGYEGTPRYYKIKKGIMNANYRSDINPALPVINGDWDPEGWGYAWAGTSLFLKSHGAYVQQIDNLEVLTELILPDGRSLKFKYNEFGEVAEVELPTGGKLKYDYGYSGSTPSGASPSWETGTNGAGSGIVTDVKFVDRVVNSKRTYPDGVTLEGQWGYAFGTSHASVLAHSSSDTLMSSVTHHFLPAQRYTEYNSNGNHDGTHYSLWSTGVEWRTEIKDALGVIAASEQDWTQRAPVAWPTYAQEQPQNDNRVNQARRFLDTGAMAKVETIYDQFNNPTEVSEHDFDQSLKRRTVTSYSSTNLVNGVNYADDSIRLLRLPLQQSVFDGLGEEQARTIYEYDVYTGDGNHDYLLAYPTITGHDTANYGGSRIERGNATRIGRWLKSTNTYLYSYPRYDIAGNVVSMKDARGYVTTFSFTDDFGDGASPGSGSEGTSGPTYAFPTLITSPPPTTGAPVQTARSQYDFSTGLLTGFKDRNGTITQTIYSDPFNRPTLVKGALGISGVENHAAMFYAPATFGGVTLLNNDVLTVRDQNALDDKNLRAWTVTDGFGRAKESWSKDPQGDVKVTTNYDALGRVNQTSNPFRPSLGETAIYTTQTYDLAGRVISVTTPDNAVVNSYYSGNQVLVKDQANKERMSETNALGQLSEVWEITAPDDATETISFPNRPEVAAGYRTKYEYDTLGNLITVTQRKGTVGTIQTRSFAYDSLSRLTSAMNPENGTVSYQYDNNGNLTQKTDSRVPAVTSTYFYDALNRNTQVDYSDATPDVFRQYDQATNGKGRLNQAWQGGAITSATYIDSYDAMGRPLVQRQLFETSGVWSSPYQTERTYNLAGGVTTQKYPSLRTVTYNYDNAGRLADKDPQNPAFSGNLGDGTPHTYARGIGYSPFGGITIEQFGTDTPLYHKLQYNVRGQLWDIRVATGADVNGTWNRGCLQFFYDQTYSYGGSGADNNGNVLAAKHYRPLDESSSTWTISTDFYTYDALNRIDSVAEYHDATGQSTTQQFQQSYTYDRWGNRTIHQTNTWGTGIPKPNFGVDPANNNRLTVPAGYTMSYDQAGNVTNDTYTGQGERNYDAENRMVQAWANGQWQVYTYNADGQRVRRKVDGAETWQIYGMDGELLAEYPQNGSHLNPQKEYGYRNGQLLVEVTAAAGGSWGSPPTFSTPNPLVAGQTEVKASHITELRTAINALRGHMGMPNHTWQYSATTSDWISANPILEMRTALDAALGGPPSGGYSAGLAQGQLIKAIHIQELRDRVLASWNSGSSLQINWMVADHLGTPRIIVDKTGALANVKRHDYLPFGEELFAGTGGRTAALGYSGDNVRQKFTSKERDNETGLDYFLARHYSSTQGRFTSPDEFKGGPDELWVLGSGDPEKQALAYADVTNPQSLNKYQYTFNNPLRYVDQDGKAPQESAQNKMNQANEDLAAGRINEKQYWDRLRWGGYGALAGVAAVLATRGGAASVAVLLRWANRNPEAARQVTEEIVQASSGNPTPSKLTTGAIGLAREARVAEITGGQVVRQGFVVQNVGKSEIDVIGKAGEYIAVGGPAKAGNLSQLGKQLSLLRTKAEQDGVTAVAYFAKGTPESVLKIARRRLGAENVHIFEMK